MRFVDLLEALQLMEAVDPKMLYRDVKVILDGEECFGVSMIGLSEEVTQYYSSGEPIIILETPEDPYKATYVLS